MRRGSLLMMAARWGAVGWACARVHADYGFVPDDNPNDTVLLSLRDVVAAAAEARSPAAAALPVSACV